jgi:hypothetical protein
MTIRSSNTFIRPKWGIYRSLSDTSYLRDETLRFNNFSIFEYKNQSITFNPIPIKAIGDADFSPGAIASSGLPVSYTSSNTNVATIVNNQIHITGLGSSVITATQIGNDVYSEAPPAQQTLVIPNLNSTINTTEDAYTYGNTVTTNYGNATSLQIKENGNVIYARKSYLKFDLSGLSFSSLGTAKIRLFCNSVSAPTTLTLATCSNSWTETGINYNTAPAPISNLSSATVSLVNTYSDFDASEYIRSCLKLGVTSVSFVLYDNSSANTTVKFNSREVGTNMPEMSLSGLSTTTSNITDKSNSFSYYYNATTKNLSFNCISDDNVDVTLSFFNLQGQLVKVITKTIQDAGNQIFRIDLSTFHTGIYLCRLNTNSGTKSFKLSIF